MKNYSKMTKAGLLREIEELLAVHGDPHSGKRSLAEPSGLAPPGNKTLRGKTDLHTEVITGLKRTEEELRRLNRLYAVLSMTDNAIVHATERESLLHDICRVVIEHGGFQMVWLGLLEKETGEVKPVAKYGVGVDFLEFSETTSRDEPEGRGPTGTAIREGRICIINDYLKDPSTALWHKEASKRDFRSAASISLKMYGEPIGALTVYAAERDFFRWQYTELLQQLADDISFALENLDREERRKEAVLALQRETAERMKAIEDLHAKDRLMMLQSRQAAMGEMIGNIAHQWRQPLNNLGLLFQLLPYYYDTGELTRDFLERNTNEAMGLITHMSQTINDFRNFFMPEKERLPFEINRVIGKTLSLVEASLKDHSIKITTESEGKPSAIGYPNEFSQVILTILNNASDAFSARKTKSPDIRIKSYVENGKAVVTISDNAGGIQKEIIEKVFDPYFSTKDPEKGTGIGLFMAKNIIENNMNGSITVTNSGDGAEFRIEI